MESWGQPDLRMLPEATPGAWSPQGTPWSFLCEYLMLLPGLISSLSRFFQNTTVMPLLASPRLCPFPQRTPPCQPHATTSRHPPPASQLFLQQIIPRVMEGLWTVGPRGTFCPLETPGPMGPQLWRVLELRSLPTWASTMAAASFSTTWRWKMCFPAASGHHPRPPCTCPAWKPTETPPA